MLIIGLAGQAGVGKGAAADYLVAAYGCVKLSFAAALYQEVAKAYDLGEDEFLLRDRATKEKPISRLSLEECSDHAFVEVARTMLDRIGGITLPHDLKPLSPRQVLQWWGTQYRRAQNENYWILQVEAAIGQLWSACAYPEHRPQLFVCDDVRFENERKFISCGGGGIWHIRRDGVAPVNTHESENPLPVLEGER